MPLPSPPGRPPGWIPPGQRGDPPVILGGAKVTDTGHRVLGFNTSGATGFVDGHQVNQMLTLLGDYNVRLFMPPMESTLAITDPVQDMGPRGQHGQAAITFDQPCVNRGNIMAWRFNGIDEYLEVPDNDLFSFGDGLVDYPFSLGCWFKPVLGAVGYIIDKRDDITPNMEYCLYISNVGSLQFLVMDDSSGITGNRGRSTPNNLYKSNVWRFGCVTYDGIGGDSAQDGVTIYSGDASAWDGVSDTADIVGAGAYVAMENTVQPVMIGATDRAVGPNPLNFLNGEMCLLFLVGGELPAGVVERVYRLGVEVMQL